MATARGVEVNQSKTHVQQPAGAPTAETLRSSMATIRTGNHKYGGNIGVDDQEGSSFVSAKLAKHDPIMRAIRDPVFPSHLAPRPRCTCCSGPCTCSTRSHARHSMQSPRLCLTPRSRAHGCV